MTVRAKPIRNFTDRRTSKNLLCSEFMLLLLNLATGYLFYERTARRGAQIIPHQQAIIPITCGFVSASNFTVSPQR